MSFEPLKEEIKKYFPNPFKSKTERVNILCPGSGLGRLPFDFAVMGYASQGNECSY